MMSRIHRLDPIVANQIAAGEVVERPASVVKELVENSLDANARHVVVEIENGGWRIDVRDDGVGMHPEDLALAVDRHTTSKLTRLEDLESARTLGFRGEALAAIGSVSELTLTSRTKDAKVGHRLAVRFGEKGRVEPVAMAFGTRVEVSHVFALQPARQKALKTPAAEFGAIQQTLQQLAIARPDVRFEVIHDGRAVFDTPGQGHAEGVLLSLFGRELVSALLPVSYETERGVRLTGFVGPAHVHRANRLGQGIYVNGRWIGNWALRAVVEEAFRPQLPDRRYPYFWLWLDMPPNELDPNAHPTKAEVRLYHEQSLKAILYRQVKDALVQQSVSPAWTEVAHPDSAMHVSHEEPLSFAFEAPETERASGEPVLHRQFRELVPLGQWHAKYILAQGPEGLYLIDQHAAHERIFFERFRRLGADIRLSQPLLVPVPETLSAVEWASYQEHAENLRHLGFSIDELGGTMIAVRAVPTAFHDLESHQGLLRMILELLSGGEAAHGAQHPVSWAEEAHYAMAACKAAIKANRPMSYQEMTALLDEMSRTEDPRGCPHGRPTMIVLTVEEVDRRFGRRG